MWWERCFPLWVDGSQRPSAGQLQYKQASLSGPVTLCAWPSKIKAMDKFYFIIYTCIYPTIVEQNCILSIEKKHIFDSSSWKPKPVNCFSCCQHFMRQYSTAEVYDICLLHGSTISGISQVQKFIFITYLNILSVWDKKKKMITSWHLWHCLSPFVWGGPVLWFIYLFSVLLWGKHKTSVFSHMSLAYDNWMKKKIKL